jgi:two-component system response regulator VicR
MGKKILVADDSRTMGAVIKHFLEEDDYEIVYVSDGQQALDKICEEKPDLIILDIILPKIDGYQIARYLREGEDEELKKIPIIILTSREALIDETVKATGLAEAYILKPFDNHDLLRRIGTASHPLPIVGCLKSKMPVKCTFFEGKFLTSPPPLETLKN